MNLSTTIYLAAHTAAFALPADAPQRAVESAKLAAATAIPDLDYPKFAEAFDAARFKLAQLATQKAPSEQPVPSVPVVPSVPPDTKPSNN